MTEKEGRNDRKRSRNDNLTIVQSSRKNENFPHVFKEKSVSVVMKNDTLPIPTFYPKDL
jgi:hypothetical protein